MISVECFRCTNCGKVSLQRKRLCPDCGSREAESVAAEGAGQVVDWVTINYPGESHKHRGPYAAVIVRLDNGCKVLGTMVNNETTVTDNARVRLCQHDKDKGEFVFASC